MYIKSLKVEDLFGKNYSLNFKNNLTILYGLNGSGKTTIINILFFILNGEIEKSFHYNYKYLKLIFNENKNMHCLEAIYNFENENYDIKINEITIGNLQKYSESYTSSVNTHRKKYINERRRNDYNRMNHSEIGIEKDTRYIYLTKILEAKNELVYVPLDRKVTGIEQKLRRMSHASISQSNRKNIENSLNIAENYYKEYQRYIIQKENKIHESMRIQILTELSKPRNRWIYDSILNSHEDFENLIEELKDVLNNELEDNVKKLLEIYIENKNSFKFEEDNFVIGDMDQFLDYAYATAQLKNLHNVTEKLKDSKKAIDDLKHKSTRVLESINRLLKETEKKIVYDKTEGEFYFTNLKKQERISLNFLSSGEKQLIMFYIFSIIKFDKNETKILFIDEPELSLHIDWQSKLLPSIVSEEDKTQVIIATHSPDIIGKYIKNTVEVKGVGLS